MNDEEVVSTTLKAVAAALKLLLVPTIGGGHLGSTSKECCLPYREMNSTSVIVENIEISIGKDIDIPSQSHQFLQKSARLSWRASLRVPPSNTQILWTKKQLFAKFLAHGFRRDVQMVDVGSLKKT
jgi:hypothetical protein